MKLKLSQIITNDGTNPRFTRQQVDYWQDGMDEEEPRHRYINDLDEGAIFPALTVFHNEDSYWLVDGFLRLEAYKRFYRDDNTEIEVDIIEGTLRDAILYSCSVNPKHGVPRTNADKRHCVLKLLYDDEWRTWSNAVIAEKCLVSGDFVGSIRDELTQNGLELPTKTKGRDGKYRDTSKIGRKPFSSRDGKHLQEQADIQIQEWDFVRNYANYLANFDFKTRMNALRKLRKLLIRK